MTNNFKQVLLTLLVSAILVSISFSATFSNLSERLPANANTLVLVNTEEILKSPVAQEEGWREEHEKRYDAGLTIVPPAADRFLMASDMDLEFFQPIWESAIVEVHYEPSVPDIAVRNNGTVDNIEGRDAAVLPNDTYVIKFGPKLVGALSPANRQSATRWMRRLSSLSKKSQSPYLMEAMQFADKIGTPVIMAIDFEGAISEGEIRDRLESMQSLNAVDVDKDQLAKTLAGIRGVTLGVTLKNRAFGKLKVDFNDDVPISPEVAKQMILEVLAYRGAMIDEFNDWKPEVNGKQISIEGPLFSSGLRRLFSVLDTPDSVRQTIQAVEAESDETREAQLVVVASQQYFKSTQQLLDDLKDKKPNGGFKTAGQIGMWYGRYADKIDRLPMANVDPELLSYGGFVSSSLRQAQGSMRSISQRKRVRQANANVNAPIGQVTNTWEGGGARWGRYGLYGGGSAWGSGWSGERYSAAEQRAVRQRENTAIAVEERMRGYSEATNVMTEVANATGDVRRRMSEKYKTNF